MHESDERPAVDQKPAARGAPPLTVKQEIVTNPPLTSAGQWIVGLDSKGLMFLLAKQLSPSGVSSLGRIVLPKREAEAHLPHLVASEGVLLTMTDYDTRQSWIFRYRFWSNNKSRMYLLENTRDFVKAHNLQERDTLVLYKDADGSYVVRGDKNGASQCPKHETSPHEAPTIEEEISRKQQTLEFLI
jgi:bifunctional DNA-binding transcriptional regulator/antitoxin component of YhaV-PrlF toxin-antitoxin module